MAVGSRGRHWPNRWVGDPTLLAYIPALIIGFLAFTLILSPYRFPVLAPPNGEWPEGEWPPVTLVIAAWNEEDSIAATLERIGGLSYAGAIEVVLADNNSTDRTAELAEEEAQRHGLHYRRVFEAEQGKYAPNAARHLSAHLSSSPSTPTRILTVIRSGI